MARTSTQEIEVDGRKYRIARLSLGQLREFGEQAKTVADAFALIALRVAVVLAAMKRADEALAMTAQDLEAALDGEDLTPLYEQVMAFSGKGPAPAGEPQSP